MSDAAAYKLCRLMGSDCRCAQKGEPPCAAVVDVLSKGHGDAEMAHWAWSMVQRGKAEAIDGVSYVAHPDGPEEEY